MNDIFKKWLAATGLGLGVLCCTPYVHAENHALIMWIGEYADSSQNLPGIDLDAKRARKIASYMGVIESNIIEYSNRQLTLEGMQSAIQQLVSKIKDGDKVMIYYSGHGNQINTAGGTSACSQGIVAYDGRLYFDNALRADLDRLALKASQIVMLNDSCFSGGGLSKNNPSSRALTKQKSYQGIVQTEKNTSGSSCGVAVNKLSRNLQVVTEQRGTQMLYVAASADNEVSFAEPEGSLGTRAWEACLAPNSGADRDGNGLIDGSELKACAQDHINRSRHRQTVTLLGNAQLLVSFAGAVDLTQTAVNVSTPAGSPATGSSVPVVPLAVSVEQSDQGVNPVAALQTIQASSDPSYTIQLALSKDVLKIRQDFLDFSVTTNRGGYLYLLHVGSDGKTYDVLFPNSRDSNNQIAPGIHRFPRADWAIQPFGPAGTGYLMAYISDTPKNVAKGMQPGGIFSTINARQKSTRNLGVVMIGAEAGASGRFGTSQVVPFREIN